VPSPPAQGDWSFGTKDPKLKADFEKQAAGYRKLAEKRAKEYGLKMPSGHDTAN